MNVVMVMMMEVAPILGWYQTGPAAQEAFHPADLYRMGQLAAKMDHEPVVLYCPTSKAPLLRAWRGEITLLRKPYGGKKIDWQGGAMEGCMGDEEALRLFIDGYTGKPPKDLPDYPKNH